MTDHLPEAEKGLKGLAEKGGFWEIEGGSD